MVAYTRYVKMLCKSLVVMMSTAVVIGQSQPGLMISGPAEVNDLELIHLTIQYPEEIMQDEEGGTRWSRLSLAGEMSWPQAVVRLESDQGKVLIENSEQLKDPRQILDRYVCNVQSSSSGPPCRPGESFPLQVLTGRLSPGSYRVTVSLPVGRFVNSEEQQWRQTLVGEYTLEVKAATKEEREKVMAEHQKIIAQLKEKPKSMGFAELAPLLLDGSPDSLRAIIQAPEVRNRQRLARMMRSVLMYDPERGETVAFSLAILRDVLKMDRNFERALLETLICRAEMSDIDAITDVIDHGPKSGRAAALCLASYLTSDPEIQWSPLASYVAKQVTDVPAFKTRMKEAQEVYQRGGDLKAVPHEDSNGEDASPDDASTLETQVAPPKKSGTGVIILPKKSESTK